MRKLGWFIIGGGVLTVIIKFTKIALIVIGVIVCLVFIHKTIIRHTPQKNPNLKWRDKS